jgi:hypothetical protein
MFMVTTMDSIPGGSGVAAGFGIRRELPLSAGLGSICMSNSFIEKKEVVDEEDAEGECKAYECKVIKILMQRVVE